MLDVFTCDEIVEIVVRLGDVDEAEVVKGRNYGLEEFCREICKHIFGPHSLGRVCT